MLRPRSLLVLPLPLLAAAASHAQPRSAAAPWQVDWGQYYCSMIRQPGEGRPFATVFLTTPGDDSTQIMLVPEEGAALPRGVTAVALMPEGRIFEVSGRTERRGARDVLVLASLPYDLREAMAGAGEIQLKAGSDVRARIPLDNPGQAIAAHRRCTAEIAREWGVDEAALAALRQRPLTTNLLGVGPNDYPEAALRTATQGRVIVRIDVSPQGRATDCATVATSGSAEIDAVTCRVVRRRARFRPAIDAAGRRVAARIVSTVAWVIPSN